MVFTSKLELPLCLISNSYVEILLSLSGGYEGRDQGQNRYQDRVGVFTPAEGEWRRSWPGSRRSSRAVFIPRQSDRHGAIVPADPERADLYPAARLICRRSIVMLT